MFHEFVMRVVGFGIASLVYFTPVQVSYNHAQLTVSCRLTNPITDDARTLASRGFVFSLRLYCSAIVNESRVYRTESIRRLACRDSVWSINDTAMALNQIQTHMGTFSASLDSLHLTEGDRVLIYCAASILPDSGFEQSTGLSTSAIWSYYIPQSKSRYILGADKALKPE